MLSLIMTFSLMGGLTFAADDTAAGTPYTEDGTYDVNVSHVVINQVYGGSTDGYADYSFIELYNPTDAAISLSGWTIAYKSSNDGDNSSAWETLSLTGTIPANGYYLIRCAAVTDTSNVSYNVPEGDQEWDMVIHNKGVSVALFCQSVTDDNLSSFSSDVISDTSDLAALGYVDMVAVQGNDGKATQQPQAYETSYSAIQSKKKAVRRSNYTDTDNNSSDLTAIDYSGTVSEDEGPHNSSYSASDTDDDEDETEAVTYSTSSYEEDASLNLELANSISIGSEVNADGGVAEIVAYNSDTSTAYAVNGQDGKLYYFSVTSSGLTQTGSLDVETLIEEYEDGFSYGDLTSVAVDTVNDHIALAVQAEEYDEAGRVLLLDYDLGVITTFETGVQPDMVTFTPDGSCILTADEGEPRDGYGEGTTDPAGTVTIIDLANETITCVGFCDFTAEELTQAGVLIGIVDGVTLEPEYDLEPEYIAVSSDGSTAYVSLQEANAIAVIDIESGTVTAVTSLGFKDYSDEDNAVDLQDDGQYLASTYENVLGVYMPDSISTYEVNGVTYIVTANEGDAREWGDYTNETKVTLTDIYGNSNKVRALDSSCVALPTSDTYLFGGRSFAIYQVGDDGSLTQVYESGSDFEEITAEYLSTWFNCSNDDVEIDSRSQKKGPEPEGVAIGTIGDKTYAFIGLERIGGIMVYDITDPSNASYVNYINTRDFSENIAGDVSPEGLAFAVLSDGTPMLLAAYEVSGTVAAYTFTDADGNAVTTSVSESQYSAYTVTEHNYVATETVDATCTKDGSVTYVCSFCGDTYTETIEKIAHANAYYVLANEVSTYASEKEQTAKTRGTYVYYCPDCGKYYNNSTSTFGLSSINSKTNYSKAKKWYAYTPYTILFQAYRGAETQTVGTYCGISTTNPLPTTETYSETFDEVPETETPEGFTVPTTAANKYYFIDEDGTRTSSSYVVGNDATKVSYGWLVDDVYSYTIVPVYLVDEPELSVTQTVSVSDNLKNVLTVEVENYNEYLTYTYQWYKDGEAIDGETDASLLVDDDDASYSVTVTATAGDDCIYYTLSTGTSASSTYEVDHVHTYVWSRWGGWTTDEDGNLSITAYAKCSSCGDEQDVEELTDGGRTVTYITYSSTAATCTEDATVTYKARIVYPRKTQTSAAYTVTLEGTATGHTAGEAVIENEVAATCTKDGSYDSVVYCTVCGEELSRTTVTVEATGHSYVWGYWGEWSLDEDGTPTVTAYVVCEDCGDEQVAGETRYSITTLKAATCTQQEVLRYAAYVLPSTGGLKYNLTRYDVTGDYGDHSYEVTETVDATCTEDGYTVYTCSICGDSYTETISSTGHTASEAVIENEVAAACTEDGSYDSVVYCTVCGEELSRETVTISASGHSYNDGIVTTEVTCTEDGVITYTCSVCGDTYTVSVEATGHSYEATETVGATETEDGYIIYTCSACGDTYTEVLAATGSGDTVESDETTAAAEEETTTAVSDDEETTTATSDDDETTTAASADEDEPEVGDQSSLTLWLILAALAVLAAAGACAAGLKRRSV